MELSSEQLKEWLTMILDGIPYNLEMITFKADYYWTVINRTDFQSSEQIMGVGSLIDDIETLEKVKETIPNLVDLQKLGYVLIALSELLLEDESYLIHQESAR